MGGDGLFSEGAYFTFVEESVGGIKNQEAILRTLPFVKNVFVIAGEGAGGLILGRKLCGLEEGGEEDCEKENAHGGRHRGEANIIFSSPGV